MKFVGDKTLKDFGFNENVESLDKLSDEEVRFSLLSTYRIDPPAMIQFMEELNDVFDEGEIVLMIELENDPSIMMFASERDLKSFASQSRKKVTKSYDESVVSSINKFLGS